MSRPTLRDGWATAALLLAPLALTVLLYSPTLALPYYWDDAPLFNFVTNKSFLQLWTDATGLPYYRPIAFTLYKIASEMLPFGDTAPTRVFMLLVHAASSLLVGKLAAAFWARASGHRPPALLAATAAVLFAAFPFAALPLVHFAAVHHPLVILLTTGGVLAIIRFSETGRGHWLALALGLAALAPYALEAGVTSGSVIALAWLTFDHRSARRHGWALALLPVLSALFLPVWALVPKSRPGEGGLPVQIARPDTLLASATFFWQAVTYPVQPLAALILDQWKAWDLGVILAVGAAAFVPAVVHLWRRGLRKSLAFAIGWTALTSLPSIAALPFDYIAISPRLLYFQAAGGVILWATVVVALASAGPTSLARLWLRWSLAAVLGVGALAIPAGYLARHARLHVLALTPLAQLDQVARQYPGQRHLILNTVNWLAPKKKWYPLGNDGVPVLAPYMSVLDLVYANTGVHLQAHVATFPDLRPDLADYYLSTANESPDALWDSTIFTARAPSYDHIWLTMYSNAQADLLDVGHVTLGPAQAPGVYRASFEDTVYLTNADFVVQGRTLILTLDWVLARPGLRPDATIFRNVFDCAGNVLGLGSGPALGGMLALPGLPPGARIHDIRNIPLDAIAADGCYQAEVGFFLGDGSRLVARGPDGAQLPNQLALVRR